MRISDWSSDVCSSDLRIIFLDYDGTLVGFNVNPLRARPDKELFTLLDKLMGDDRNRLILISGRKHETLDEWYSHLPLDMIAEHGAWTKKYEEPWRRYHGLSDVWKKEIRSEERRVGNEGVSTCSSGGCAYQ